MKTLIYALLFLALINPVRAAERNQKDWQVFFSPKGGCTEAVVDELGKAKTSVIVQAYSFTSAPIAKALVDAKTRGVNVQIILDRSQKTEKYTSATYVFNAGTRLHHQGHAHSVECWLKGELVGGIYGVAVGGLFAGESMFHRVDNASKVALCSLVEHLRKQKFTLFDVQMVTEGTWPMGATEISRSDYLKRLAEAVVQDCVF